MIRIITVMLAAFFLVSALLSVIILQTTKNDLFSAAKSSFDKLIIELGAPSNAFCYDNLRSISETAVSEYVSQDSYGSGSQVSVKRKGNVQIVLKDISDSNLWSGPPIVDTDDYYSASFISVENGEKKKEYDGVLSYKRFRKSMTDDQYAGISYYLKDSPSETEEILMKAFQNENEGVKEYYQLVCTEFYVGECQILLPKTVEVVLTNTAHDWYTQDRVIERYELYPRQYDISGRELKTVALDRKAVLSKDFFYHSFSSGNLKSQFLSKQKEDYPTFAEVAPYRYLYGNYTTLYVNSA